MPNNYKPILYMLISTLSFALMNTFIKYLQGFSTCQLVFFRSIGTFILTMSFLTFNKINLLGTKRSLLILRALIGMISMGLFFRGIQLMPIGTAVSLRNLSPIFATIFAVLLLKEKVYPIQFLFFLIALAGVALVKGFDTRVSTLGLYCVIGSAFLGGLVYVLIHKIGKTEHPLVIVNYLTFFATLIGGLLSIRNWHQPQGTEWLIVACTGIFGFFGQLFMTKAFQNAQTNLVAPFKYSEVLFALLIGFLWLGEGYTTTVLLGILLIITGLLLNVLFKNRRTTQ